MRLKSYKRLRSDCLKSLSQAAAVLCWCCNAVLMVVNILNCPIDNMRSVYFGFSSVRVLRR